MRAAAQKPAANPRTSVTPMTISAERGCWNSQNQSIDGSRCRTFTPGSTCVSSAQTSSAAERTASTSVSTSSVAASVAYVAPFTRRRTSKSLSRSPPRTGMTALTPTPAAYAPKTLRQRTFESGYAAARMFRQARERTAIFRHWQARA